jgi:hypothetical protein
VKVRRKTADGGAEEQRLQECEATDVVHRDEASQDRVHEPAASDAGDRMGTFEEEEEEAEAGGAYADMGAIAVHTEEHIAVQGRPCEDGNILDMKAAASYLVALVSTTCHVVSAAGPCVLGYMAVCLMDDGS